MVGRADPPVTSDLGAGEMPSDAPVPRPVAPDPGITNADADMSGRLVSNTRVRTGAGGRAARFLITVILIGGLFLSRFVYHVGGLELSFTLVVTTAAVVALALLGQLRVHLARVALFAATLAAILFAAMAGGAGRVSVTSVLLLVVVYTPYIFILKAGDPGYAWCIVGFRTLSTVIAIAGILQFFGQLIIPGPTLFTFIDHIPEQVLTKGYNLIIPVPGMLSMNKSNGFFLTEPSIFSQVMALAIIVELLFFALSWRLMIFVTGSFVSFSGTGLILIAAFVPFLLLRRGDHRLFLIVAGFVVFAFIFFDTLHISAFTERTDEFSSAHSSGFGRFLSPFYLFDAYVLPSVQNTLFGLGPGAISPPIPTGAAGELFFSGKSYEVHDPTWGKLFFEYGLVGFLPFSAFVVACFFADSPSRWLSAALFVDYALLGGNLVNPILHPLFIVLAILHKIRGGLTA
jgi:hypothetical protein